MSAHLGALAAGAARRATVARPIPNLTAERQGVVVLESLVVASLVEGAQPSACRRS